MAAHPQELRGVKAVRVAAPTVGHLEQLVSLAKKKFAQFPTVHKAVVHSKHLLVVLSQVHVGQTSHFALVVAMLQEIHLLVVVIVVSQPHPGQRLHFADVLALLHTMQDDEGGSQIAPVH